MFLCDQHWLWFAQVAYYGAYLQRGEEFLPLAVAGADERFGELGVMMDPVHQTVDGSLCGEVGRVGHGELRLAHGAHTKWRFFFHRGGRPEAGIDN